MTQEPRRAPYRQGADPLDRLTAILIAAVTIVAATAAFLQTDASNHADVANRDAQNYSLESVGLRTAGQAEVDYGWYGATHSWFELDTLARTAEQDGDNPAARRYRQVRDRIANLSPLLQSPYFDKDGGNYPDLSGYETDRFLVDATELSERNTNAARLSNEWDGRANSYILHLTLLAVALALLGLSATRATWTRKLFVSAGSLIVLVTVCWMAVVAIGDIEETPDDAMNAFARGYGLAWRYQPQEAIEAFDEALAADPSYANAYYERGNAHLNLAFSDVGLDPEAAQDELTSGAEDLESARDAGKNDKNVNWNLGFVYYLTGDFDEAIAADERALDEDPTLFPVSCNLGLTHLAAGEIDEARDHYASALDTVIDEVTVAKQAGREPPSSLLLYLDLCASDLDSLRARLALDPKSWTQAPPRDAMSDSDELRREVDRLLVEIKDHLVALEYTGLASRSADQGRDRALPVRRGPHRRERRPGRRRGRPAVLRPGPRLHVPLRHRRGERPLRLRGHGGRAEGGLEDLHRRRGGAGPPHPRGLVARRVRQCRPADQLHVQQRLRAAERRVLRGAVPRPPSRPARRLHDRVTARSRVAKTARAAGTISAQHHEE